MSRETEMSIEDVLAHAHRKHGHDGIYERTPADDMIEAEEGIAPDEWEVRVEAFRQVLRFIFAEGPHPGKTTRRVYCLAKAFDPALILDMSVRDLGKLFGESHGAWSWRVKQVVNEFVEKKTGQKIHLSYSKKEGSSAAYSAAQKGNTNRRTGERRKRLKGG